MRRDRVLLICAGLSLFPAASEAVIIYGSQTRNTAAPSGALAGSGWQYQGLWGGFLGTAISPHHFITAAHVGGGVGGTFTYQGIGYTASAVYDDPNTDLRIVQVSGNLPSFAPMYSGNGETGEGLVVFGRGTQRGAAVTVDGVEKGWLWGTSDGVQSWGVNTVDQIANAGSGYGSVLLFGFTAGSEPNEAALSAGDSGGAVFIDDGGTWKLAGINLAVSGPYSYSDLGTYQDGEGFNASIYDESGLYVVNESNQWTLQTSSVSGYSMATQISARQGWIQTVVPEPTAAAVAGVFLAGGLLRRRA